MKYSYGTLKGLYKSLLFNGLALGILMGLLEVCWTYLLPVVFSERRYALPDTSLFRFFIIAVISDVIFIFSGCIILCIFIWLLYRISRPICFFLFRPVSIRFYLIAGILSYLYRGNLFIYILLAGDARRLLFAVVGIFAAIVLSLFIVLSLEKLSRCFKNAAIAVWFIVAAGLIATSAYNYNCYKSSQVSIEDIPIIGVKAKPNILLITIDTLRADQPSCYGNKIVQTPTLNALARDGHLFENAFCQAPYTTPSHCSIMTSLYMSEHEAINGLPMKENLLTIAEIMKSNEYNTAAFVSCGMVRSKNSRLHRGFDHYDDSFSPYTSLLRLDELQFLLTINIISGLQNHEVRGNIPTGRLLKWIEKKRTPPFFCWLHYFDPHSPYDAPEPYKKMYDNKIDKALAQPMKRARYAGEVTYTDSQLGIVIKTLKEKGLYDNTMIIVTSDHGEAFGEKHDDGNIVEYGHGYHLYDTTQHVPLLIKLPGEKQKNQRIKQIVQLIDIVPTLLEYLEADIPSSFQGDSLIELLKGNQPEKIGIAFSQTIPNLSVLSKNPEKIQKLQLKSARTDKVKYIQNTAGSRKELYDLDLDKNEYRNIILQKTDIAKNYEQQLINLFGSKSTSKNAEVDQRTLDQLKSLGYIDGDNKNNE